jgi:hypothetical protein
VRLQHRAGAVRAVFDDPNLLSCTGLEPVMRLAEQAGLHDLIDEALALPGSTGSNPSGKVAAIIAGMLAGADSIDDCNLIRHGGMRSLFTGVYAPSTLGSFLRTFTHGHALQLHAAARNLLVALADRVDLLPGIGQLCFIDIDSMLRRVYGKQKQGAGFGHAKVGGYDVRLRGLSPLLVTLTTPRAAPVIAAARLRAGNAASVRGATSLLTQAIGTARTVGATGEVIVRGDSAFYTKKIITACRRHHVRFSVTTRIDAKIRTAIAGIDETTWIGIKYPNAVWDDEEHRWISEAQIAETTYTAFEGTRHAVTARLIVRRVPRQADTTGQGELFAIYRYHAVFTDSPFVLVEAESQHRQHAVIEQINADLIDGPLAHLPSGRFAANSAWLTCAAMVHNLTRAAGALAAPHYATARGATIRRELIHIAARIAHRARGIVFHLPEHWPWRNAYTSLFTTAHAPPAA